MAGRNNGRLYECVVVDLNTQYDYCDAQGVSPVANVGELIPAIRHMVAWAKRNYVPVISSIESHRPSELSDSGYPICCVDGSPGQRKIGFTLFPYFAQVEADNTLSCPTDLFKWYQQVIFRKRRDDLLSNPKADQFLTELPAAEFIVFGIGLEGSVKALALGLLAREKPVTVVLDACGYWSKATGDLVIRQITAKGARCTTVCDLLQRKLNRRWRYPMRRQRQVPREFCTYYKHNGRASASAKSHPLRHRLPTPPPGFRASDPNRKAQPNDA